MSFWLITIGERYGFPEVGTVSCVPEFAAMQLARAGHDVAWWTPVVDHFRKQCHAVPVPPLGQ